VVQRGQLRPGPTKPSTTTRWKPRPRDRPKLIIAGASAYSLRIDFERFAKVAKDVGAIFMVDMAHYAGLIAAGVYPNPVPHADVVTSTTHKSLRGPRGGIILMKAQHEKAINSAIFPGLQGGPLMHVIAAKAVAFKEALTPEFKAYQQQVVKNAQIVAETLTQRGLRIVSGRTESHVMLVDLRAKGITGKEAEAVLGSAHMTINKNAIPNDPEKPMVTSGVRIGTPAMTTRGFKDEEARLTANLIADVLDNPRDPANIEAVRAKVNALTAVYASPSTAERRGGGGQMPLLRSSRNPGRRDPGVRRRRLHPPPPPVRPLRKALHHLRAARGQLPGGGEEGRPARRLRARPSCAPRSPWPCASARSAPSRSMPPSSASRKSCSTWARAKCQKARHPLGEMVMRELKKLDKVAYVRFASVYRSFEDIDEFRALVDGRQTGRRFRKSATGARHSRQCIGSAIRFHAQRDDVIGHGNDRDHSPPRGESENHGQPNWPNPAQSWASRQTSLSRKRRTDRGTICGPASAGMAAWCDPAAKV
jgi:hypothetical protein